jgi:hypothetical protein
MMIDSFLSIKPFDRADFSVIVSLKEALSQTLSTHYFKAVGVWLLLYIVAAIFLPEGSAMFVDFIGMVWVNVAWFRFLGYGEEIPLIRFGKKELWYLVMALAVGMVAGLVVSIPLGAILFLDNGNGGVILWAGLSALGALFLYIIPYMHLYFGLLALGFRGHFHKVKEIVRPMGFSMWGGYIAIMLVSIVVNFAVKIIAASLFEGTHGIQHIVGLLGFLTTGITATFTSHIIYIRASYKKPDGDDGEVPGAQ